MQHVNKKTSHHSFFYQKISLKHTYIRSYMKKLISQNQMYPILLLHLSLIFEYVNFWLEKPTPKYITSSSKYFSKISSFYSNMIHFKPNIYKTSDSPF